LRFGGMRALDAQRAQRTARDDEATALRQGADPIHLVRTLWIFDARGQARASSDPTPAPGTSAPSRRRWDRWRPMARR